jgi:hypothetical protein
MIFNLAAMPPQRRASLCKRLRSAMKEDNGIAYILIYRGEKSNEAVCGTDPA